MSRRKSNPSWIVASLIGIGGFLVGGAIATAAMKRDLVLNKIYNYWAEESSGSWIPMIQDASTGEIYELNSTITEQGALFLAEKEILDRNGTPRLGKPKSMNPAATGKRSHKPWVIRSIY